jgi:hypothetical protein
MAKHTGIEVDEEYMMSVIAGDVPSVRRQMQVPKKTSSQDESSWLPEMETVEVPREEAEKSPVSRTTPRRKKESQEFAQLFLGKQGSFDRHQVYISREIYRIISRFLPVIGGEISLMGYIDNVLRHHLEQYRDEINDLYEKNYKKPFGNEKE